MSVLTLGVIGGSSFFLSLLGTCGMIYLLSHYQVFDVPNKRSSHVKPTPRGGGFAVWIAILAGVGVANYLTEYSFHTSFVLLLWSLPLVIVSLWDDFVNVPAIIRLSVQFLVVFGTLFWLSSFFAMSPFLMVSLAIGWVWFINLYNFMDGIDGITSIETVMITIGVMSLSLVAFIDKELFLLSFIISMSALGFLFWNWSPAKIFLGDVGSVFLGFIVGGVLCILAGQGHWIAALILSMYYLLDSTVTLALRVFQGKKFWQAHKEHFYQQAVQSGMSHEQVTRDVLFLDVFMIVLAVMSIKWVEISVYLFVISIIASALLLCRFRKKQ